MTARPVAPHEAELERLRRRFWVQHTCCACDSKDRFCNGCSGRYEALYTGEDYYAASPALLSAFRKGSLAWAAGQSHRGHPYRDSDRRDRRGRYNAGFRPAFINAWCAGWAWAQWTDPAEVALRALAAPPKDFHDPDRRERERAQRPSLTTPVDVFFLDTSKVR